MIHILADNDFATRADALSALIVAVAGLVTAIGGVLQSLHNRGRINNLTHRTKTLENGKGSDNATHV